MATVNSSALITTLINWVKANSFWFVWFGIMALCIVLIVTAAFLQPIIELFTGA